MLASINERIIDLTNIFKISEMSYQIIHEKSFTVHYTNNKKEEFSWNNSDMRRGASQGSKPIPLDKFSKLPERVRETLIELWNLHKPNITVII